MLLVTFNIFSLFLIFVSLIYICLGVFHFRFVVWASALPGLE